MAKKAPVQRPQEELLGQSTPFNVRRLIIIYLVLLVAVSITTAMFMVKDVMDWFQAILTLVVLFCVSFGIAKAYQDWKMRTYLYETWFQVGNQTFSYDELTHVEYRREQVFFSTGNGFANRHSFYAGNASALTYLLEKKRKAAKRARVAAKQAASGKK